MCVCVGCAVVGVRPVVEGVCVCGEKTMFYRIILERNDDDDDDEEEEDGDDDAM